MVYIPEVKIVEPRITKWVQCPYCGTHQRFKKKTEYWHTVKTPRDSMDTILISLAISFSAQVSVVGEEEQ